MKLHFKHQPYQEDAVEAVADCFLGQPKSSGLGYRLDPGKGAASQTQIDYGTEAFRNAPLALDGPALLENIRRVQRRKNLPESAGLVATPSAKLNLDIEMETGTGKTYVYLRTIFELNRRYGWGKFIIVVPSIAIREGVRKSLEITASHFLEDYQKKIRFFTYDSKHPHQLESFSSDGGINVMVINVQAFNAKGADARRIDMELDDFQSRKPIDVIRANHPILILDEPQKLEGKQTAESLAKFSPLFVLRYSATHRKEHNRIHRLDALDAYQQKLVKKIRVNGIAQKGLSGTNRYLYLEGIVVSKKAPLARLEFEVKDASGTIRRLIHKVGVGANLKELSKGLNEYDGFVVSEVDAIQNRIAFTNGTILSAGQVTGEVNETTLRRIQIRETIRAHFDNEKRLFDQGIKVISLFFIDEVAKYKRYQDGSELPGEYAGIFEQEYDAQLNEELELADTPYQRFLKDITARNTHNGYFSIDRKTKRLVDPAVKARGEDAGLADDVDAYDLILRDKETLLSYPAAGDDEVTRRRKQVRFIFSHSALREGWDNPNVFVICTLKHSDNSISRRQEVGRGMRICVNQSGERMDHPATVHDINVLTVVANESYESFVKGLQGEMALGLASRPKTADVEYFTGKLLTSEQGVETTVTKEMAKQIYRYLAKHEYSDDDDRITETYHAASKEGALAELPVDLQPHAAAVFRLIDSVFSEAALPPISDQRAVKRNALNDNFHKTEFQDLWRRINHQAVYTVDFDSEELIRKAAAALNRELRVEKLRFQVTRGEMGADVSRDDLSANRGFVVREKETEYHASSLRASVRYDLVGSIATAVELTRRTVASILGQLELPVFNQFRSNPEAFISRAATLIKEQKATMVIEHIAYDPTGKSYDSSIFAVEKNEDDFASGFAAKRHIYDFVFTDSKVERAFAEELDVNAEVTVYGKLPKGFVIPTPVGDYNPDWAIAFEQGSTRHLYFVAETKGDLSSLQLKKIEKAKIDCARKFFAKISDDRVKYGFLSTYQELLTLVN